MFRPFAELSRYGVSVELNRNYLRHDVPEHVLCFAPIRSDNGVVLEVPSLLSCSVIVHVVTGGSWHRNMAELCCLIRPT